MELIVRIVPEDEKKWYAAECDRCGWIGSSEHILSDGTIADTGCCGDVYCPCCKSSIDINETENLQPVTSWIEILKKATDLVKILKDTIEGLDLSKHIYSHLEEENKAMAKELYELKNKQ